MGSFCIKNKIKSGEAAHWVSKGITIPLAEGERGRQSLPKKAVKQAKRCFTDGSVHVSVKPREVNTDQPNSVALLAVLLLREGAALPHTPTCQRNVIPLET